MKGKMYMGVIVGILIGGAFGIILMCLVQVNRENEKINNRKEDDK